MALHAGCASTLGPNSASDAALSDGIQDAALSDAAVDDATNCEPCAPCDWLCRDMADPGDAVVWVDSDIPLPWTFTEFNARRYGVRLSRYWIGRYEVTNAAYRACISAGRCLPPISLPTFVPNVPLQMPRLLPNVPSDYFTSARWSDYPALVNWHRARQVCQYLEGDLPTKAQWQFAGHTNTNRRFPWGDDFGCEHGNYLGIGQDPYDEMNSYYCPFRSTMPRLVPVNSFLSEAGPLGTLNLIGNVAEPLIESYDREWISSIISMNRMGIYPLDARLSNDPLRGGSLNAGGGYRIGFPIRQGSDLERTGPNDAPRGMLGARCVWQVPR